MKGINSGRASLVLSSAALFVSLGGTAMAVTQIGSSQIRNGAISTAKLKNAAVTSVKLKNGSVNGAKIVKGAVSSTKLAAGAVTAPAIAAGAVGSTALAGGAVGTPDVAPNAITSSLIAGQAVGTPQLGLKSVTNAILAPASVTNSAIATGAVNSASVQDGSLTSSDVAPNTFLAANGTATNSNELGGVGPSGYVQGTGQFVSGRVVVPAGGSAQILELNFAHVEGVCSAGAVATQEFVAELNLDNVFYSSLTYGSPATGDVGTANAVTAGNFLTATHSSTVPQAVTWQGTYSDGGSEQVATAWVSGQDEGGSCVFIGQGTTTLG